MKVVYFLSCVALIIIKANIVHSSCLSVLTPNGTISDRKVVVGTSQYRKCWEIMNPSQNPLRLQLIELNSGEPRRGYTDHKLVEVGNLTIVLKGVSDTEIFTFASGSTKLLWTQSSKVEIHFKIDSWLIDSGYVSNFTLEYHHVENVDIKQVRSKTINLLRKPNYLLSRNFNTLKALIALYLSGNATFNGSDVNEELMVSRAEMRITSALQKNSVSKMDLSTYINVLCVVCDSPRLFGFHDLIQQLLNHLELPSNFTHPLIYLALCNANEAWPQKAVNDLQNILNKKDGYIFLDDIQEFAIMAISCQMNQTISSTVEVSSLMSLYNRSIHDLMQRQLIDGSFGSVKKTAIAAQALLSSGEQNSFDWSLQAAIRFIAKELNSTSVDFQTLYLSLPVLNEKSLADIVKRNCSGNPKNKDDFSNEKTTFKIEVPSDQVRYSLYIGDEKELIRTTTFRIHDNFTAYQVMSLAEIENSKYNFLWRRVSGKMYVYTMAGIANDPENGKFWFLYKDSSDKKPPTLFASKGPDEVLLKRGDHLIMWYKTANI